MPTARTIVIGCKVNQCEAAHFAAALARLGWTPAEPAGPADIVLVHTCAITGEAVRKCRQAIRAAHQANPNAAIAVTGCWATHQPGQAAGLPGVAAVIPHRDEAETVKALADWLDRQAIIAGQAEPADAVTEHGPQARIGDEAWDTNRMCPRQTDEAFIGRGQRPATVHSSNILPPSQSVKRNFEAQLATTQSAALPPLTRFPQHSRAFLKVQDGCDAHCSYCIVPQLRNRLRSRPVEEVVDEAAALLASGYRELVLTGVFLGAYGRPTAVRRRWADPPARRPPLVQLLDAVSALPGLRRVRLSSLEPGDVTDELLELMASRPQIAPHLHLPLQSGSAAVLTAMNRQYDPPQYRAMIGRVRARLDRPALSTDVIVGFPGETDADFMATLELVRFAGFVQTHVFRFSPRPGTPAARRTARFVPAEIVRQRARRLAGLADSLADDFRREFLGQTLPVIIERPDPRRPGVRRGVTDRYFTVEFALGDGLQIPRASRAGPVADPAGLAGRLARVRLDRLAGRHAVGTLISVDD